MEWKNPIVNLSIQKYDSTIDKNIRKYKYSITKKYNNICCYCGGNFSNYNYINSDNSTKKEDVYLCCKFCHMILNFRHSYCNSLLLCWSDMSQIDIVRNSIDYIIINGTIPQVSDIDKNAKNLNISLIEYINIINNKMPDEFKKYKIFLSDNYDIMYLVPLIKKSLFKTKKNIIKTRQLHKFSKNELKHINKYLGLVKKKENTLKKEINNIILNVLETECENSYNKDIFTDTISNLIENI